MKNLVKDLQVVVDLCDPSIGPLKGADLATAVIKTFQKHHNSPEIDALCDRIYPLLRQRGVIDE
jgi:hypothetical protein